MHTGYDVTDNFRLAVIEAKYGRKCRIRRLRCLYISRTVRARTTKFYRHIQAGMAYIGAEYDVTTYFRSEATAKKTVENAASGGISRECFKRGLPNFTGLSGTTVARNMPDMTSLVTSGRL